MTLHQYIDNINKRYALGNATEHTFRGDLQQLIESLVPTVNATNEPKRQKCGAPDYIITHKQIPVGFIEAKDIGDKDLDGSKKTGNKEQFDRYKQSLNNILFTDYVDFHLYRDGQFVMKIAIGEVTEKGIKPLTENFASFENFIKDFCTESGQTIKSSKTLAKMMAGKARLLSQIIEKALNSDEDNHEDSTLKDQMHAFKQILIHDITPKGFADVYAQTITYGMFAARLHDPTLPTFSRQEAFELIPKSNPFLKKLFGYIAGLELDERITWIVDDLVQIFLACNVEEMLNTYGKNTKMEDPIIHFYEDFLSKYDPALRKARGVWYTPQPVVNFIVRAVDDILKKDFGLAQGLADNSKTSIKIDQQGKKITKEVHRVQILDPATGTGTFLAEVVKHIYKKFQGQQGIWSNYVEQHLLPRLNGFELLMASYAMAHLKLDLLLTETGYAKTTPPSGHPSKGGEQRLRVYLTNSLEESHPDTGTLFANWLSAEANEANHIKRDTPVMCIIGNPPYSVSSSNKSEWIESLTADYKKNLKERNIQPLSDDYIKFIRFGQHFIDKNGSGVLAYISNNSFIDGIIHRQMRKHLLESFDKIYIIDLHGNAKKKETAPDGSVDQNVFDIMQGVSINIFVKTGNKKKNELGKVFHYDLYGKREVKYEFLLKTSLHSFTLNNLTNTEPSYYFVSKNNEGQKTYDKGFKIDDVFICNNTGLNTEFDELAIQENKIDSIRVLNILNKNSEFEVIKELGLKAESTEKVKKAMLDIRNNNPKIVRIKVRPFENKYCIYTGKSGGIMGRPRHDIMKHLQNSENLGFISMRQYAYDVPYYCYTFLSREIVTSRLFISNKGYCSAFPLYLYRDSTSQQSMGEANERTPNLNMEIVQQIAEKLGMKFVPEKLPSGGGVADAVRRGGNNKPANNAEISVASRVGRGTRNYMKLPYNPQLKERAKELRKAGNLSEIVFWNQIKNKQFKGLDFDRQKIVGNYIVDFFCTNYNVVIEIDGSSHDDKVEYDAARDAYLEGLGLSVIHISDTEVLHNLSGVMEWLHVHPAFDHPVLSDTPPEEGNYEDTFAPIDILDYIYAVLHSPTYREKYKEFLKIDFPRVPYPKDATTFWKLVKLGSQLREIHLLESSVVEQYITQYPVNGTNMVVKPKYVDGKVYINDSQYFDKVPLVAWEFYIGGYQPAQKWLKDRKDRQLEFDDILHYQKIIVALTETDRLMKAIDEIIIE